MKSLDLSRCDCDYTTRTSAANIRRDHHADTCTALVELQQVCGHPWRKRLDEQRIVCHICNLVFS